jgi:hypothetical protein
MSNILDDPYLAALRQQHAHEYFLEASRPFAERIATIHAIYARHRMTVSASGEVLNSKTTLPDFAKKWVQTCEQSIELCRVLAFNSAMNFYP